MLVLCLDIYRANIDEAILRLAAFPRQTVTRSDGNTDQRSGWRFSVWPPRVCSAALACHKRTKVNTAMTNASVNLWLDYKHGSKQ